jgi:hypothetical protein
MGSCASTSAAAAAANNDAVVNNEKLGGNIGPEQHPGGEGNPNAVMGSGGEAPEHDEVRDFWEGVILVIFFGPDGS